MKKYRILLIILLTFGLLLPVMYTMIVMGSLSRIPKVEIHNTAPDNAPKLKVVADFDFSPYTFYDNNDQITGFDVELINEIANRLGMKAEITFTDWISCKKMLQTKETDLILGLEIFSHLQGVLKTIAISNDQLLVFGKNEINDIAALKDKRVGLMANSVIEKIFDLNCEYVAFYTNTQILDAVEDGTIDYGICHGAVGKKILEKTKYDIVPSVSLMASYPAIGVRDDLPELRDKINEILIQLSNEKFITKLNTKWLINFTNKVTLIDVIHSEAKLYIIYFIFLFIIIAVVVFFLFDAYHRELAMKSNLQYQSSLKKQNDMLTSVAGVYFTMHAINLVDNTVKEIHSSPQVRLYVNKTEDACSQMIDVMKNTVTMEDIEMALNFTDLTTLSKRMGNKKTILIELRGTELGWFCAQFIAMEHNKAGEVTEVIFTTQSIDEMMKEKQRLLQLSHYDELSHLLNRHAYDAKIKSLRENNQNQLSVVVLDVNNLKATNDKIGHRAGDEMICGAADCIREAFKDVGTSFRMGGDEFVVLIEGNVNNLEEILDNFRNLLKNWKGELVNNLSLSIGCASYNELQDFTLEKLDELEAIADKRMYADKALYYKTTGIDRRS